MQSKSSNEANSCKDDLHVFLEGADLPTTPEATSPTILKLASNRRKNLHKILKDSTNSPTKQKPLVMSKTMAENMMQMRKSHIMPPDKLKIF